MAQWERIHLPKQETWVRSLNYEDAHGEGNGNPLQYSYRGNPMDRGVGWAIVLGGDLVTKQHNNILISAELTPGSLV